MSKTTVYFKKITQSKKGVVFCVNKPTASQVKASGKSTSVDFKMGNATVTGRKAFHNFGQQYFVQLDCSKLTKTQIPKAVINNSTGEAMPNLNWGYAG